MLSAVHSTPSNLIDASSGFSFPPAAPKATGAQPAKNHSHTRREAVNGKVDPIRSAADIRRIADFFYQNEQYRDWCMFLVGINCGLRISDLTRLRLSDVANPRVAGGYQVKPAGTKLRLMPQKTANRKKYVTLVLNATICQAIQTYLNLTGQPGGIYELYFQTQGWLFPSGKSSGRRSLRTLGGVSVSGESGILYRHTPAPKQAGDPIDGDSYGKILRKVQKELALPFTLGTHSLRKTFGYRFFRQYQAQNQSQLALAALQKVFAHSSPQTTLAYIGIPDEEIESCLQQFDCGIGELPSEPI